MSTYGNIGESLKSLFYAMAILIVVFVPLGLWKAFEIVVWFFHHIGWHA